MWQKCSKCGQGGFNFSGLCPACETKLQQQLVARLNKLAGKGDKA